MYEFFSNNKELNSKDENDTIKWICKIWINETHWLTSKFEMHYGRRFIILLDESHQQIIQIDEIVNHYSSIFWHIKI
jgi:hypothetical protein